MATAQPPDPAPDLAAAKRELRGRLLAARRRRTAPERDAVARALAEHLLASEEVRRASTVAAYAALGSEPGTAVLLDALAHAGVAVVLPVLLPDGDLDWARAGTLVPGPRGLWEPDGPRLGVEAVAAADVVLVPGLAVSPAGMRLGRGGGSYDRALARLAPGASGAHRAWTCVLLHDDEVGLAVPTEAHDREVDAVVTPREIRRF